MNDISTLVCIVRLKTNNEEKGNDIKYEYEYEYEYNLYIRHLPVRDIDGNILRFHSKNSAVKFAKMYGYYKFYHVPNVSNVPNSIKKDM